MNYIEKYGIKFHWNFKLLHKSFGAITLFGHVYTRKSKHELEKYLKTKRGRITANHERIHMLQAQSFKLKYFTFYVLYISYWIKNLFTIGLNIKAYENIPFEKEAYANQSDFEYDKTFWKKYK